MWEQTIKGVALANLNSLEYYQREKHNFSEIEKDIGLFVVKGIDDLPLFFRFPIKIYSILMGVLALRGNGIIISRAEKVPFFGVMNKLVKAMVFLRLFDKISLSNSGSGEMEKE